ncbi:MAG: YcxB family protein [Lachnospiraceae bacterium]
MYQFCYTLSERDYLEFIKYHAFNTPENKKSMLIYRFVVTIIFIACGLAFGSIADEPDLSYIVFGIVVVLWLILFKWIEGKRIEIKNWIIKKNGNLYYQSDVTIYFKDDFYTYTTEIGEEEVKYSAIERVIMNERAIYIYTNAMQAILLPFIVFSNEQNRDDFMMFIEEKRLAIK